MTPFSVPNKTSVTAKQEVSQNSLIGAMKWFWHFSNFYGEYNSLPPSQRNRFASSSR